MIFMVTQGAICRTRTIALLIILNELWPFFNLKKRGRGHMWSLDHSSFIFVSTGHILTAEMARRPIQQMVTNALAAINNQLGSEDEIE